MKSGVRSVPVEIRGCGTKNNVLVSSKLEGLPGNYPYIIMIVGEIIVRTTGVRSVKQFL